ncbi:MAG: right-handed parallel beta-helix repeat-containing protein [Opitutaceae bacterium]|nr:right-handed parallel beta-helix repeat-containing protein [Opitutaceae bacterium]
MILLSLPVARTLRALVLLGLGALSASAAPSGGPYGPIRQRYEIPAGATHILYVAPDGKAEATGATLAEPTALATAIARAVTGDVIVLRGGTYRTGNLLLNQGITLQPYADEQPVIKGTKLATGWTKQRNGLWRTAWTSLFPARPADWWHRESVGQTTPMHRFNNDMVFLDGKPLQSAGWEGELKEGDFYIDYEAGQVYLKADPTARSVEITAHDGAITRVTGDVHGKKSDQKGYTLRGLTFTQYAYRALEVEGREPEKLSDPATFGKEVVGTTIENCTITQCSRVGGYFRGDRFTLRNCLISDTSTEGIYVINSADCLLEKNIFARNNVEKIVGYYPSAVKIFNQSYRVTCRDNLVMDQPESNGIWYDVGNVDGVFVDNWIENCTDGFFFEISKNAIVAGNVFVNCEKGVRSLNSCGVQVYHNTFVNTGAAFERDGRSAVGDHFGWHPSTGPDVEERVNHVFMGNLMVADTALPLPAWSYRLADASPYTPLVVFGQPQKLAERLKMPHVSAFDGNVYVRSGTALPGSLVSWSPSVGEKTTVEYATLAAFRKAQPAYETHSQEFELPSSAVVRSVFLKNYELVPSFTAKVPAETLPAKVQQLLGWSAADATTPGAYPTKR